MKDMDKMALDIAMNYVKELLSFDHLTYRNMALGSLAFVIVWKCKTLQNWKYIISTVPLIREGMMFELTYNGDKKEWYLDAYAKFDNKVIKE